MPKISVIVPVYNIEKYLHICVDSILAQTFTDFELLLIDDGSTDGSSAICDEYVTKDSRVRVFHKENGGVSSARNLGLENAEGEWISFVDSDDNLTTSALLNLMNNNDCDLVIGGYENQLGHYFSIKQYKSINSQEFKIFLSVYVDTVFLRTPWAKLFNHRLIKENKLLFDENLVFGEDHVFNLQYLTKCNKINIINNSCYHYYDIGADYISKYKQHNERILDFAKKITSEYSALNELYGLCGERIVYGFIFDIIKRNLDEGTCGFESFRKFLLNKEARKTLKKRSSLYIKIMLVISYFPTFVLKSYLSIINKCKK